MRQLVPQRDSTLQNEFRKQQSRVVSTVKVFYYYFNIWSDVDNEMLRRQFAEKANQVGPWIERQLDAVTAIGMGLQVLLLISLNK